MNKFKVNCGFTLIELIITLAIISILASASMPLLSMTVQRTKENELKTNLRQIREAIDAYKKAADDGRIKKNIDETGYPPSLDVLVEGVKDIKSPKDVKIKFLRKIPIDPFYPQSDNANDTMKSSEMWGLRSYASDEESPKAGDDVYDVYSLNQYNGSNGIPYAKW